MPKVKPGPAPEANELAAAPIELTLPIAPWDERGYTTETLHLRLSHSQAKALRSIQEGADATQARLANGQRITSAADTCRYILEQIAAQLP